MIFNLLRGPKYIVEIFSQYGAPVCLMSYSSIQDSGAVGPINFKS